MSAAQMEARPYPRTLVANFLYQLYTELNDDGFHAFDNDGWRSKPHSSERGALLACEDRLIGKAQLTGDSVAGPEFGAVLNG